MATLAAGESYPRSWNYVSPDVTALVGIEWQHLRESFLGDAVGSELSSSGHLGIPDLKCLQESREILLSAPDFLAIANGTFPAAAVESQANSLGMTPVMYKGVRLWISPRKDMRSVAQVNDTLLLIGWRDTLHDAIDRSLETSERDYPALLARGARLATNWDFWITATGLPDPLVKVFLPLDLESFGFDGGLNAGSGLQIDARYNMASTDDAIQSAEYFQEAIPSFHPVLHDLHVIPDGESVLLKLDVSPDQLAQYLRPPEPKVTEVKPVPPKPLRPPVVRIFGLDDGPREIKLSKP
jgi:hypothetical protein